MARKKVASKTPPASPPPRRPRSQSPLPQQGSQKNIPQNMGPPGVGMIMVPVQMVGIISTHMICPNCHNEINTIVRKSPCTMAYVIGGALCFLGCFWGCCLIPCCLEDCQDADHSCPVCGIHLGTFRRYY